MLKISLSHIFSSVPSNRLSLLSAIFFYLCLSLFLSLISRPDMPEMRRLGQLNQSLGPNGKQQQNIQQNGSRISTEDRNTIRPSLSQHCRTHAAFTCTELNVTVINSTCWRLMSSLIVGHVLSWAAFGATITNRSLLIQIADTIHRHSTARKNTQRVINIIWQRTAIKHTSPDSCFITVRREWRRLAWNHTVEGNQRILAAVLESFEIYFCIWCTFKLNFLDCISSPWMLYIGDVNQRG